MKTSRLSAIFQRLRSNAAETLAEVIIAITVLSLGTGSATILVLTAVNATTSGETRLVAYNLAREGVEAVRNIRDTNWLRFPGDRDDCWDTYNLTDPATCNSAKLGATGIGKDITVTPNLTDSDAFFTWTVNETSVPADQKLYTIDINATDPGGTFYVHDSLYLGAIESPYSRSVNVLLTPGSASDPARMLVTSTVSWDDRGVPRSVEFKDQLINH
jgi:hypothetical protein